MIRDSTGSIMGSLAAPIHHASEPELVEVRAMVKALEFARDMGIQVEGDSLGMINRVWNGRADLSTVGVVIDEIKL